jgi:hypothetical protein
MKLGDVGSMVIRNFVQGGRAARFLVRRKGGLSGVSVTLGGVAIYVSYRYVYVCGTGTDGWV